MEQTSVEAGVKWNSDYCGKCMICPSVCPFKAILADEKTHDIILDIEKCQVCGICSSACPALAIDTVYYDVDSLVDYLKRVTREVKSEKLVLMCQSASAEDEVGNRLKNLGIDDFVLLRVPCVGRIPPEFILKALALGIKKMVILPCEENYCRFKNGSNVGILRFLLLQNLLNELGFEENTLIIIRSLVKARVNVYRCIGCGNCASTCPANAIRILSPGIAQIDESKCSGCSACTAVCPTYAISLEGFNHESIPQLLSSYRSLIHEMKQKSRKPVILVFYCQWANFPPLYKPRSYFKENVMFLELPCSSAVDSLYVLQAFYEGFDGVIVVACKKGECKFEKGNELAEQRVFSLKKLLGQVKLEDRLGICFVSPNYLGELDNYIKSFINKIQTTRVECRGMRN